MTKNWTKYTVEKNYIFLHQGFPSNMREKPLGLKREYPALQNMEYLNFFNFCGSFLP
jgi:hypothetical protein